MDRFPVERFGSCHPSAIVLFGDIKATTPPRRINDGDLVCAVTVTLTVDMSVDVDEDDYRRRGYQVSWLSGPGSWHEAVELTVSLELTLNTEGSEVATGEVTNVSPSHLPL